MKKKSEPSTTEQQILKIDDVKAAFLAAGYTAFEAKSKTIKVEKVGGKRDTIGNKEVIAVEVHDLFVTPRTLLVNGNWPAIDLVQTLGLQISDLHAFGNDLIIRDVRNLQ